MKWLNTKKIIGWGIRCWRICIDLFIIGLGIYSIYYGVFDVEYLIRCIKILCILLLYWFIAYNLGMGIGTIKESAMDWLYEASSYDNYRKFIPSNINIMPTKRWQNSSRFFNFALKYSDYSTNSFSMSFLHLYQRFIRVLILLMPWMWFYLFLCFLAICLFYLRVVVNGMIDIFLKKHFDYHWDKSLFNYEYRWWYKMFVWLVKYPVLRFLFYPLYLRMRIINKNWKDLIRIRFIAYFYIIFLVFLGYNDLIYYAKSHYIILFIISYLYFTVVLPIIFYGLSKIDYERYEIFLYPCFYLITYYSQYTITLYIFENLLNLVKSDIPLRNSLIYFFATGRFGLFNFISEKILSFNRVYIISKYKDNYVAYSKADSPNVVMCLYGDDTVSKNKLLLKSNYNLYTQSELWKYEKYYYVPCFVYEIFFNTCGNNKILYLIIMLEGMWQEGVARYGLMFMDYEYGKAYEQCLEFFKCWLFFIFDLQRLCGIKFDINGDVYVQLYQFKLVLEKQDVPLSYNLISNIRLYKEVLDMANFFASKPLLNKNGTSYISQIFSSGISGFSNIYKNLEDYAKRVLEFDKQMSEYYSKEFDFAFRVSLADRLELDTPGIFQFFTTYRLESWSKDTEEKNFSFEFYKEYIMKDFIKFSKKEYDKLYNDLKIGANKRTIILTKNIVKNYNIKYNDYDKFTDYSGDDILFYLFREYIKEYEDKSKLK